MVFELILHYLMVVVFHLFYDSMLAKIIVYDSERKTAIRKMKSVLKKIK